MKKTKKLKIKILIINTAKTVARNKQSQVIFARFTNFSGYAQKCSHFQLDLMVKFHSKLND